MSQTNSERMLALSEKYRDLSVEMRQLTAEILGEQEQQIADFYRPPEKPKGKTIQFTPKITKR